MKNKAIVPNYWMKKIKYFITSMESWLWQWHDRIGQAH